ncbi:YciI family protein [Vulcaniibacterium tengchongense]|uniref:YCII-related domain-containing protein n=1 Tax=Vulcaniibacterium tengchongense TaxID=1273429 RepID=A0A3N4VBZ6_9GAMM|nr:YciI family protein [Vulcaniibacterium tengchongense]RPE77211.1 hypothetical protein EDC50_2476 [Vulcaniibacterium tengchongense]
MRYLILVKASKGSEAGAMPDPEIFDAMAHYHEQLAKAGVLLDANGLHPSSRGWRVRYRGGQRSVVDGPFAETKELIAGYTLIQTHSRDEAVEWSRRFPNPHGEDCEIEVRPLFELDDFAALEGVRRFRRLGVSGA